MHCTLIRAIAFISSKMKSLMLKAALLLSRHFLASASGTDFKEVISVLLQRRVDSSI